MADKKKVLPVSFLILSLLIYLFSQIQVQAQSPTSNPVIPIATVFEPTSVKKPSPQASVGAGNKAAAKQQIVKRVATLASRMLDRANDSLLRLDGIWSRVQARIEKFKAAGKDVSSLAGFTQQVDAKRTAAADAISGARPTLNTIENSTSPKTSAKSFIDMFKKVKTAIKDYHQAINTVITNIKGMSSQTGTGPSVIPPVTSALTPSSATATSIPAVPTATQVPSPTIAIPTPTVTSGGA